MSTNEHFTQVSVRNSGPLANFNQEQNLMNMYYTEMKNIYENGEKNQKKYEMILKNKKVMFGNNVSNFNAVVFRGRCEDIGNALNDKRTFQCLLPIPYVFLHSPPHKGQFQNNCQ